MTAHANKMSYKEIFTTIFLRTLPATVLVVLSLELLKKHLNQNRFIIEPLIYNIALIVLLLLVLRFTAWNMLHRLAAESDET